MSVMRESRSTQGFAPFGGAFFRPCFAGLTERFFSLIIGVHTGFAPQGGLAAAAVYNVNQCRTCVGADIIRPFETETAVIVRADDIRPYG